MQEHHTCLLAALGHDQTSGAYRRLDENSTKRIRHHRIERIGYSRITKYKQWKVTSFSFLLAQIKTRVVDGKFLTLFCLRHINFLY